jgi:hypothetical protein
VRPMIGVYGGIGGGSDAISTGTLIEIVENVVIVVIVARQAATPVVETYV